MPDQKHLLILTGDHSADGHAAAVARALRAADSSWRISGVGGGAMRDAGVELIADHSHMNVMGPAGIIAAIPSHRRLAKLILQWVDQHRPDVAMLVDYGMFHLWLGPRLRERGVRVLYFIPPQIWGSRPWRINRLRRAADQVLCILPFEEQYYRARGIPAKFVGNPLTAHLPPPASRAEIAQKHGLDSSKTWIGLFPGSRRFEIRHLLRAQLDAMRRLMARYPGRFEFALARASNLSDAFFERSLREATQRTGAPPVKVLRGENHALLSTVDVAVAASGTVTLEAALYGTPMIIMYRGTIATYFLARLLMTVDHIGMPNLLAGREIMPELWQHEVTGRRIAKETLAMLEPARYQQAKQDLSRIAGTFNNQDAARQVAQAIERVILPLPAPGRGLGRGEARRNE